LTYFPNKSICTLSKGLCKEPKVTSKQYKILSSHNALGSLWQNKQEQCSGIFYVMKYVKTKILSTVVSNSQSLSTAKLFWPQKILTEPQIKTTGIIMTVFL
jgi:hypothetical protein